MRKTIWQKTAQTPPTLAGQTSPFVIGPEQTEIHGDPASFAEAFARQRAMALTDVIDPAFFAKLLRILEDAQYITDTVMDRAHRERERPGKVGFALSLALKRANLLRWLEQTTGTPLLESAYGRVLQFGPDSVDRLNWHDDLPDDPLRRLAITINLTQAPYEGGLFELREKKSGAVLFQHRHTTLGSALIFAVSDELQHRVWPVTAGGPRRVFTGWFTEHESSFI